MRISEPTITAFSALRGTDAVVLRQIFRTMTDEISSMRNEIIALRTAVANMKKQGDK